VIITADRIHDGRNWLPEGTAIEIDGEGNIIALHNNISNAQYFEGVLCPGFVNVHCHLELSHLKGQIPEHTGLVSFLQQVMSLRPKFSDPVQRVESRRIEFEQMCANGIVAVGDISNTNDTTDVRGEGKIHFHSFVEALGFSPAPQQQFATSVQVYEAFTKQKSNGRQLRQSIVPHAPYSVSDVLFKMIDEHDKRSLISIHNQESPHEDEYYRTKTGGMQTLLHSVGIQDDFFVPPGSSSLSAYLPWLSASHPVVFVHNTFTPEDDLAFAQKTRNEVYWCLCPNANLYIENTLPDVNMFTSQNATICIGTDSLASNHQLCILSELVTLKKSFPYLEWEQLLQWGTHNGANALQMEDILGTIEPGKQPGILLLQNIDNGGEPTVKRIA
jgi:cytosine/adenosine deaminase-related metal-dependent hydrolase